MQRLYEKNPGKNPGRVLYNYWFDVLSNSPSYMIRDDGTIHASTHFGEDGWRNLSFQKANPKKPERPDIQYGALFVLRYDGSFRIWSPRGGAQRRSIAKHTFLDFGLYRGYNWTVDLGRTTNWWGRGGFEDWQNPFHYVNERTMSVQGYGMNTWSKLVRDDTEPTGWRIGFAECLDAPTAKVFDASIGGYRNVPNPAVRTAADFDKFEALRLRRLRLAEVAHGRRIGTHDVRGRRVPTPEEIEKRQEDMLLALVAHMDVHSPAKTTPLRREREEGLWALSGSQ